MLLEPKMSSGQAVQSSTTCSAEATDVGRQLADAQSADQAWRAGLVLRVHRRIRWLRRFDGFIQLAGAGGGVLLLVAAVIVLIGNAAISDTETYTRLLGALNAGAIVSSIGGIAMVCLIARCEGMTRNWVHRLGITEELATVKSTDKPPPAITTSDWICPDCWIANQGVASACEVCSRQRPADEVRIRLLQLGKLTGANLPSLLEGGAWLLICTAIYLLLAWLAVSLIY